MVGSNSRDVHDKVAGDAIQITITHVTIAGKLANVESARFFPSGNLKERSQVEKALPNVKRVTTRAIMIWEKDGFEGWVTQRLGVHSTGGRVRNEEGIRGEKNRPVLMEDW